MAFLTTLRPPLGPADVRLVRRASALIRPLALAAGIVLAAAIMVALPGPASAAPTPDGCTTWDGCYVTPGSSGSDRLQTSTGPANATNTVGANGARPGADQTLSRTNMSGISGLLALATTLAIGGALTVSDRLRRRTGRPPTGT